jgi:hypothetical protein
MKSRVDFPGMIIKARAFLAPSYTTLLASLTAWIASVVLIIFPSIGVTSTVYPPEPTSLFQFVLLGITTCLASVYSAIIGYRLLKEE